MKFFLLEKPPRPGYMGSRGREAKRQANSPRPDYSWVEDWQRISKDKRLRQEVLSEWKRKLKPRVSLAGQNRGIKAHVLSGDLEDYQTKLKAAQNKYAVNAAPCMFLAKKSIGTITDMATRLSIHEDVLRPYLGIEDDEKEQYYI